MTDRTDARFVNRRTLLQAAPALGLAAGAAVLPVGAGAAAPQKGVDRPSHYRFTVGDFEVTTFLDGAVQMPGPHPIFGENVTAEDVAGLAAENFLPADKMEIGFTVTLVNTGSELVLFDTGNGDTGRRPNAGRLVDRMAEAGVTPEQIDVVVITHFHGDHIGGLTEGDAPVFPNARYVTGAAEYDFWSDEDLLFDDSMQGRAQLVQRKVVPLAEKFTFIEPGAGVVSGIEAVDAAGHTPGHMAYHVEGGNGRLMIIADTSNHYVMSMQRPEWHVRFDMDKGAAVAARKAVLGQVAADRIPFVGYHMPTPSVGYLEALDGGFRYVPASYQLNL